MALVAILSEQLKEAMKSGDSARRDMIRFLQSAIKNTAIELRKPAQELSDEEVLAVVKRLLKQRKDSIEQYRAGGREDLALGEQAEAEFLQSYLPAELPLEQVESMVAEALREAGITAKSDMGKAMGVAMKKMAGQASGDVVRKAVESILV